MKRTYVADTSLRAGDSVEIRRDSGVDAGAHGRALRLKMPIEICNIGKPGVGVDICGQVSRSVASPEPKIVATGDSRRSAGGLQVALPLLCDDDVIAKPDGG